MKKTSNLLFNVDWLLFGLYAILVTLGWFSIYAVSSEPTSHKHLLDMSSNAGKQLVWILATLLIFFCSLFFETRFYYSLAYVLYAFSLLLLLCTLVWGVGRGGHRAWLPWGGQPAEFVKWSCALTVARYIDQVHMQLTQHRRNPQLLLLGMILLPVVLILLQGDVGSSLVFGAFVIVFYREKLVPWVLLVGAWVITISLLTLFVPSIYLIVGTISWAFIFVGFARRTWQKVIRVVLFTMSTLGLIEGFHFFVAQVLRPHQQKRLKSLVHPMTDPLGIGWNVTQSKIAIGAGGLWGKGFLQGSQTKYGFVPEQSTDFIFCTIGEEYGWMGALLLIGVFLGMLSRILYIAERQKLRFARIYGYSIAAILFFHFMINIGMTIGIVPVIGIPLPFVSYGGSSLWSFSLMLFVLLRFDSERQGYGSWRQTPFLD